MENQTDKTGTTLFSARAALVATLIAIAHLSASAAKPVQPPAIKGSGTTTGNANERILAPEDCTRITFVTGTANLTADAKQVIAKIISEQQVGSLHGQLVRLHATSANSSLAQSRRKALEDALTGKALKGGKSIVTGMPTTAVEVIVDNSAGKKLSCAPIN
jgi:hypothetical protein